MSAINVFISYRRSDTAGYAGRLYDALSMRLGEDSVFMDIDQIPVGYDFLQVIRDALAVSDVVLVLIGPSWLSVTDPDGRRRLDDPSDLVRLEIGEALQRGVRVIPVLVGGARMPAGEDLPEPLSPLARRHALELSDRRWQSELAAFLEEELERRGSGDSSTRQRDSARKGLGAPMDDDAADKVNGQARATRAATEGHRGRERPRSGAPTASSQERRIGAPLRWLSRQWPVAVGVAVVVVAGIIIAASGRNGGGDDDGGEDGAESSATARSDIFFQDVGGGGILKIGADGSGLVTLSADGAAPAPSPDGQLIAFERDHEGSRDIYLMKADGSNERPLTDQAGDNFDPDWSPDGRTIVFESRRDGNSEIYVMGADGSGQTRLTRHPAKDSDPTFSPDGRFIAFDSDRGGNSDIYRMTSSGSDVTQLTATPEQDSDAAWSPDGARMAFEGQRAGNFEIFVMAADGTGVSQLTHDPASDFSPNWSPDGRQIVFTRSNETSRALYVMNGDGSGQRRLADVAAGDPDWGAA